MASLIARSPGFLAPESPYPPLPEPAPNGGGEEEEQVYRVRIIEGKGRGVIAAKSFKIGELILRNSPILVIEEKTLERLGTKKWGRMVEHAVWGLPRESREGFWGLVWGGDDEDEDGEGGKDEGEEGIEGRMQRNGFAGVIEGVDGRFGYVVPEAAVCFPSI